MWKNLGMVLLLSIKEEYKMYKILLGVLLGYLFSDTISEKVPYAKNLKLKVFPEGASFSKPATIPTTTTERAEEMVPRPVGSLLFPAGQRYPIEIIQ